MSTEQNEPNYSLPVVVPETVFSMKADVKSAGGVHRFAEAAEDRLKLENHEVYAALGHLAYLAGWQEGQATAAREAMSLTYEILRRQAEVDVMNAHLSD